ncbi:Protein YIP [Purpureocillium lavendulum]|uniref:Protein YIP n=1 Tax=Purpureocillium lavendulum TaxID=1247861 RepID=A0AB34FZE0_9HYPO|nr:Protein YIP [Purpureocillium lavendulum]
MTPKPKPFARLTKAAKFPFVTLRALLRRITHSQQPETTETPKRSPSILKTTTIEMSVAPDPNFHTNNNDINTYRGVQRSADSLYQPVPQSSQNTTAMNRLLKACGSGRDNMETNQYNDFNFFNSASESTPDTTAAVQDNNSDHGVDCLAEATRSEPDPAATLMEAGTYLAGEPALHTAYPFDHDDSEPLEFDNLDAYLPASEPGVVEDAGRRAVSPPSESIPTPASEADDQPQNEPIMVGDVRLDDLGLGLPPPDTPSSNALRRRAVEAEVARQAAAPPSLPPTEVQPLPPKIIFPRTVQIPNGMDPVVRTYLEQRNNRICELVGVHERRRNNVAAKRSRVTRLESLGSYESLFYTVMAELRFYRLQAAREGLNPRAWEELTEEQRDRMRENVVREALEVKTKALREKRAIQRQHRTRGAARARGTASVKSAAQKAILRRAQTAAEARLSINSYLQREVDSWLTRRKDMTQEEVLASLDDDDEDDDDWTDTSSELLDAEEMISAIDPSERQ